MNDIEFLNALKTKEDPEEISRLLIKFSKTSSNLLKFEEVYSAHLEHPHWVVKSAAIFGLLFRMKLRTEKYKSKALDYAKDANEDSDLRSWSIVSLAVAFEDSKNEELMSVFYSIMMDDDDIYLRKSAFDALLIVYGISSVEIGERVLENAKDEEYVEVNKRFFVKEFSQIEKMIFKN